MATETIAAIATPPGIGGVGIVRVSGPLATRLARAITGRELAPRTASLCRFRDADGGLLDEGVALLFPAPRSYTAEDVLELQGHGGPVVMDLLLRRCLALGARLARPGEFTERAFLNGKLDLAQAEAVADLIESSTALAARLAGRSLQGVFSHRIHALVEELIRLRTSIEAALDFPEEELDLLADASLAGQLDRIIAGTRGIADDAHQGQIIREGFRVVIAGPPNAGKSSLLNALSRTDAAIVTPIPGTTRDLLERDIQIDGLPIRIVDTAGIRDSDDPIEQEGIRRARGQITQADLVLWIYDGATPHADAQAAPVDQPLTRIRNKIDLIGAAPGILDAGTGPEISLSVSTGDGLDLLRDHIKGRAGLTTRTEGQFIARRRHTDALERALNSLALARDQLGRNAGAELVAEELHQAQRIFGEITGDFCSDDLLGRIFSSFCIGK